MAKRDPRIVKNEAVLALDKGKYKNALKAYLELEELEPESGEWPRRAADMYRRLGQQKLAVVALERAADRYMRAGFLVKALSVCKMILQLEPSHSGVQQQLISLNKQRGMPSGPARSGDLGTPGPLEPAVAEPLEVAVTEPLVRPPVLRRAESAPAPASALLAAARAARMRTVPPDAPLDAVSLGAVVPGAIPERTHDGRDSGITEIPIEIEIDAEDSVLRPADERLLRQIPLLSSLGPDAMRRLIAEVSLVELAPGSVLFREGEPGRTLYVIAEGAVSVISEGPPRKHLSTLHEGDFFGEIAIVTNHARSATIEADAERGAHLLAIDRNVASSLIDAEPGVLQALLRFLRDRLVDRLIHTSPLFAPFAGEECRYLASLFRFLEVQPGAVILEQGSRAAGLCVLLAGRLDAVRETGGVIKHLGSLGPGGICGETSLLANQPMLFTVHAVSKAFLLQLPASVFREVIMTHPQVLVFITELAEERRRRYQAIMAGELDYDSDHISLV